MTRGRYKVELHLLNTCKTTRWYPHHFYDNGASIIQYDKLRDSTSGWSVASYGYFVKTLSNKETLHG